MNSEKFTDYKLTSIWKTIFNTEYNTKSMPELFGRLIQMVGLNIQILIIKSIFL